MPRFCFGPLLLRLPLPSPWCANSSGGKWRDLKDDDKPSVGCLDTRFVPILQITELAFAKNLTAKNLKQAYRTVHQCWLRMA